MSTNVETAQIVGDDSPQLAVDEIAERASEGWTLVGEGHPVLPPGFYATDISHIENAERVLDEVRDSVGGSPELTAFVKEIEEDIAYCRKRKFSGNWGVPLFVGALCLFGLNQPSSDRGPALWMLFFSFLYVISTFVPVYIINRYDLEGKDFNDFGWIADKFFDHPHIAMKIGGFFVMFLLMPVYAIANMYRYWGDEIKSRIGASGTSKPEKSNVEMPDYGAADVQQEQPASQEAAAQHGLVEQVVETSENDGEPLDAKAAALLEQQLPKIKAKLNETLAKSSKSIDEYGAEKLFEEIHGFLPIPVRIVVRKKRFVRFCMENRDKLI